MTAYVQYVIIKHYKKIKKMGDSVIKNYFANLPDQDFVNFRDMLDRVAVEHADSEALLFRIAENEYDKWSYARLHDEVNRLGSSLLKAGYKAGDRIGLLSENRPEWCITWLAVVSCGITLVPFDILQSGDHLENIARFSGIKALFTSEAQLDKWKAFQEKTPDLKRVICFDQIQSDGVDRYSDYLNVPAPGTEGMPSVPTASEIPDTTTASITFTSGTTGNPKGVMLSHHGILANINASIQSLPIYSSDNFVAVLPFHHTYPTTCSFLSPLTVGGRITIVDRIVGPVIIANVKETGGTIVIGVPLLFDKIKKGMQQKFNKIKGISGVILKILMGFSGFAQRRLGWQAGRVLMKGVREKAGLGSINILVAGGGPLSPETGRFFGALGFHIVQGYGMSENGPLIATNTVRYNNYEAVGLTVKRTDIQIREANNEGIGEIVVKSPSLMQGYFENPEATREIFTDDGFLKTGDLGRFDKKGFLYITGRIKNLIVSPGGKNIYPEEIESAFVESDLIGEILVVGKPLSGKNAGEEVMALCRPDYEKLGEQMDESELTAANLLPMIEQEVERVNQSLERYKRIKFVELQEEEFEKTSSQKIKRFVYRQDS